MSSSTYASALKNLGGAIRTRNLGYVSKSRSATNWEDTAQSAAPQVDPVLLSKLVKKLMMSLRLLTAWRGRLPRGERLLELSLPRPKNLLWRRLFAMRLGKTEIESWSGLVTSL